MIVGKLSGQPVFVPPNDNPIPAISPPGIIYNGKKIEDFNVIDSKKLYPNVKSYKKKFALIIPSTNTSMEYELWSIIFKNNSVDGLLGVGLHTSNVITPNPILTTKVDLMNYKRQFLKGLKSAVEAALLAQPDYMIMGMSLEHILSGLKQVKATTDKIFAYSKLSCAMWHDAVNVALNKFGAKRIGIISPFDKTGNEFATQLFEDLGFEVVASVGFSCANAAHIAHLPDSAKEKAILDLLATKKNRLDAIVQCGTNMSMIDVTEKLENIIEIPILGINAVTFWYALRETGFNAPLVGAGRLFREF